MGSITVQNRSQRVNSYVIYARPNFSNGQQVFTTAYQMRSVPPEGGMGDFQIPNAYKAVMGMGELQTGQFVDIANYTNVTLNKDGNLGSSVNLSFSPPMFQGTEQRCRVPGSFEIISDNSGGPMDVYMGVGLAGSSSPLALVMARPNMVTTITPTMEYFVSTISEGYSPGQIIDLQELYKPQSIDFNQAKQVVVTDNGNGQWDVKYVK